MWELWNHLLSEQDKAVIGASHCISLLDLWMKYAVVQPLSGVQAYLETLPARAGEEGDGYPA